jgi:hypothetical protein
VVVMLAPSAALDLVRVAGAFVIVAVTAVPLEETVMSVCPPASVVIAMYVAVAPSPSTDDKPGVRVRTADPKVIWPPAVTAGTGSGGDVDGPGPASVACWDWTFALDWEEPVSSLGSVSLVVGRLWSVGFDPTPVNDTGTPMCDTMSLNKESGMGVAWGSFGVGMSPGRMGMVPGALLGSATRGCVEGSSSV